LSDKVIVQPKHAFKTASSMLLSKKPRWWRGFQAELCFTI
jgi:hypothetical protein